MRYATFVTISLMASAVGGCGSSSGPDAAPDGMLRVAGAAELEASIKSGFTAEPTLGAGDWVAAHGVRPAVDGGLPVATAASGLLTPGSFTGTYTQEADVDEFDAVRYDGTHLYVAPQRYLRCCIISWGTQLGQPVPEVEERTIRILATDPAQGTASPVTEIPLADGVSVQGMYVGDGTMFALTSEAYYGSYGPFWMTRIWVPRKHGFRIYDVRNPAAPVLRHEASIDGVFVDSRRIGDTVYIVSRHSPSIQGLSYYPDTAEERAGNERILRSVTLEELLPSITIDGVTRPLVAPERCYVANGPNDEGNAIITSVTAVPIGDPDAFRTVCYNEATYGTYVSDTALYLTEMRADTATRRSRTRIHKLALGDSAFTYEGSAEIEGLVWRGGQADFRMSEHGGDLRAFTTQFNWNAPDVVEHKLYVLRESPTGRKLTIVSQLPNDRRPQEIGKPNEQLFGVRFFGTRGYAVTFLRIDPLYVLDLADPADPRIAGQLDVAGVSDFLHPVNDGLLLGLGSAATGGVKLELFDVSDIARPLSRGSSTLGGRGSHSEALYDRHAFTYQADAAGVDRVAIPASVTEETGSFRFVESGLYLYEIHDKTEPSRATLRPVGSLITARAGDPRPSYANRNRSFIHDNAVFYVRDDEVWSAFWNLPSDARGPF
ncbi:MAG TPA: beta-propeller domain-containing protein [Gammaproteobacteria bacterium]|nr:beta-propeller domain-containing protein [Gammaproteobacteria bacterium]